jgi:hypothetical protein
VHFDLAAKVNTSAAKVNILAAKVNIEAAKVNTLATKVNIPNTDTDSVYHCEKCYRTFTRKHSLKVHQECGRCTEKESPFQCDVCKSFLSCKQALSRHKKTCVSKDLVASTTSESSLGAPSTTNNIHAANTNLGVQNIHTQNNQTNNVNILVFPMSDEESDKFDFKTDHINMAKLQEYIKQRKPCIGFNKFVGEVLRHPENRNVQKTNPKDKYSKVFTSNNTWELALDADVYPAMTHHMTTAALGKMEEHRLDIPKQLKLKAAEFVKYIDEVNTNDEGDVYNDALERIKLMVINVCNLQC